MDLSMDKIAGRYIADARFNKGNGSIYLNLANGSALQLAPEGDCCANCYIQHVSGADALRQATVASVEDIESEPTAEELEGEEALDGWGHRITTNRGVRSIEMRTSHNGYYSGWLNVFAEGDWSDAAVLEDF